MKKLVLLALIFASLISFSTVVSAQEKKAKGNAAAAMVTQFLKLVEKAELTEEQSTKVKEMMTKTAGEVAKMRTDAGITLDTLKKQLEARKSAKESGKKGKEMEEAVLAAMGLTDEQKKVYQESEAMMAKARVEVGKLLTPEQMAKLPEQAQNFLKPKEAGKKAKAK